MKKFTLSRYFPKGTQYFYGYPAERNSHFFNAVPPELEEIVAARPFACAGPNVKILCFSSSIKAETWKMLHDELKMTEIEKKQIIFMSPKITAAVKGDERNKMIVEELVKITHRKKFLMAQPYLDSNLSSKYQIPPHRIVWLNDKKNMSSIIPKEHLPERYAEFLDGLCFIETSEKMPIPCVVKVSSSSSGDGVRICKTKKDLQRAKEEFKNIGSIIVVDEFIDAEINLGVQFGISYDAKIPMDLVACHEQITDGNGKFLGGIVDEKKYKPYARKIKNLLLKKILPEVKKKGWYGVGGFDVLFGKNGKFYFIDVNFRMTGMTIYDYLVKNKVVKKPIISFTGKFHGTAKDFRSRILVPFGDPHAKSRMLYITAITENNGTFLFSCAMSFDDKKSLQSNAKLLLEKGIKSEVLEMAAK